MSLQLNQRLQNYKEVFKKMYSKKINSKIEKMFNDLKVEAQELINEMTSTDETINKISQRVSSEITTRSKNILSDMLFELNDSLIKEGFFADIAQENKFLELNLRQEILSKYQFEVSTAVDFQEVSSVVQAIKVSGGTLVIGALLKGGLSSLITIPVGLLIAAAFGTAIVNYFALEPNKNKKSFSQAIDKYLLEMQQQLLDWFYEIDNYFNARATEIKETF